MLGPSLEKEHRMRQALRVWVTLAFLGAPSFLSAQPASTDADVQKGISLVDEGDYDAAILTLDNAARRLAEDKSRTRDLSQAYLYLGIAYMGKGHEAAARAKFRDAIAQIKDLTLSPDKFPPKVIDAFEAAKAEAARAAPPLAAATSAPAAREQPAKQKKGGGKTLLIIGGVAAAAGVAALAAGGGGGGTVSTTTTTTQPRDPRTVSVFGPITLPEPTYEQNFTIVVAATGVLEATLTWSSTGGAKAAVLAMNLFDHGDTVVATSNRTNDTTSVLTANVAPLAGAPSQEYRIQVFHRDGCDGCTATFNMTVRHP
jgi:flagellar basal body-associated protein FliL